MSTQLLELKGDIEIPVREQKSSKYVRTTVHITSFWGGNTRGKSLQIGFYDTNRNYHHIQLDNSSVNQLRQALNDNF